jgi:hypothetical protein
MAELVAFVPRSPGKAAWIKDGRATLFDEDLSSRNARKAAGEKYLAEMIEKRRMRQQEGVENSKPKDGDSEALLRAKKKHRAYLNLFSSLPASAQTAALRGQSARIPYLTLSSSGQALVQEFFRPAAVGVEGGSDPPKPVDVSDRMQNLVIELLPRGTPNRPELALVLNEGGRGGRAVPDLYRAPEWNDKEGLVDQLPDYDYLDRERGPKDRNKIAALQRKVSLKSPGGTIEEVLEELAAVAKLPLIGDYDPCYAQPYSRHFSHRIELEAGKVANVPVWKALDIIARRFDLDWTYRKGWIEVRSPRTILNWVGMIDLSPPSKPD